MPREPTSLDWDRYTWPEAIAWFARGFGAVGSVGARRVENQPKAGRARQHHQEQEYHGHPRAIFGLFLGHFFRNLALPPVFNRLSHA